MNKLFNLSLFAGCLLSIYSCSHEQVATKSRLPKLKSAPPGTNHLRDNLFIDETEVSNMTWREYMYWMKRVYGENSPLFKALLPDTMVWKNCLHDFEVKTNRDYTDLESLVYLYLRHPQYNHYPVVGISFEQATRFCAWRSNRANEALYVNDHKNVTFPLDSSIVIPKKLLFRLPSEEEWEYACREGFDSSKFVNNQNSLYYYTQETTSSRPIRQSYDKFIPMMDQALKPDKYNRYHLIGNVAEMISEKGIAKGGSYIHSISKGYYSKRIYYKQPDYWLGFRCVCEVMVEK